MESALCCGFNSHQLHQAERWLGATPSRRTNLTTPTPIKIVKMSLSDRGEIFLELDANPTEEFKVGFKGYWSRPTGSVPSAFDRRVFDRFEGAAIVFNKMLVEEFEKNQLGVAKDAVTAGNTLVERTYTKKTDEAAARVKAKEQEREDLEAERVKAERVKFD
jgi:hypothetical protein